VYRNACSAPASVAVKELRFERNFRARLRRSHGSYWLIMGNRFYQLDAVSLAVWRALDGTCTARSLAAGLSVPEINGATSAVAAVTVVLDTLLAAGLVVAVDEATT